MTTASRRAFALALAGVASCACGPASSDDDDPVPTLLEWLRGQASASDLFHGIARRGADCTTVPEAFPGCSDVYRIASVSFEVDWAPEGLYLPVDAPAFESYEIGGVGNFPVLGPGYISVDRWVPADIDGQVTITCGDVVIPGGLARAQPWLPASDEEVAASAFTHEELRAAIQEGTAHRVNDRTRGQVGGCPGDPTTEQ